MHPSLVAFASLCFLALAAAPAAALDAGDRTITPGMRVGAIVRATPPGDIVKIYGARNVAYEKVYRAEGEERPGAVVYRGTPAELQIGFTADGKRIEFIRIVGQAWKTAKEGIRIGTTLAELERINGRPFQFYGFDWDYGGNVIVGPRDRLPRGLGITLAPAKTAPERERRQVAGDKKISSRHPVLEKMGVTVRTLVVAFPR